MKHVAIAAGVASCALSWARGQGLMDIGRRPDEERLPFSLSISSSAGWDSEPGASSSTDEGTDGSLDSSGSGFWQNDMGIHYPFGNGRHRFRLDGDYSSTWYVDPPPGTQEFQNTGGLHLDYVTEFNQRFALGNTTHLSYATEPDFQVGASVNRPTSGYFFGTNNLWIRYNWSTRFSTVSSYTINSIFYDGEAHEAENHITHVFSEEVRYALTQKTTATFDYRFSFTEYQDNPDAESESHFVLLGVERPLGRFLSMSVSGGMEFRSYDGPLGRRTEPYSEASILYHARENTTFRLYYRGGLEDTGTAGEESSFSRRTGLTMTHRITPRLSMNLALDYIDSDFTGSSSGQPERQENTLHASAGLNYTRPLWRRLNFNANYSFSMVSSDDELSEYERHRLSLGVSAIF